MKFRFSPARAAVLALTLPAAFSSALAQTTSNPSTPRLREVVVTATRVEQPITDVVADVSIIEQADIERMGATTVTRLLATVPGLQTIDNNSIYIRGAESRMTALYIDGVRVDSQDGVSALGGGAPWDLVPVSEIEHIEILRGPASAVYGSDAMGGVIQIFTKRGRQGFAPYAEVGAGSRNTRKIGLGFSGGQNGFDYALGVGKETSDGFNTRPDLVHTPDKEGYSREYFSLRLGYDLSSSQRIEWFQLNNRERSSYVNVPFGTTFAGPNINAFAKLGTSALKWKSRWSETYSTAVTLSRALVARSDEAPYDYRTVTQSALLENNIKLGGGNLAVSLEQKRDKFFSEPTTFDPAFNGARTDNAVALGYGKVVGAHSFQVNVRSDHDDIFGTRQTGALAYGFAISPSWLATASAGTAFRAPTLEQAFGPYGSKQLQPETNRSQELGLTYKAQSGTAKAVVYRNTIRNLISSSASLSTCSAGFFCYFNVGEAEITGMTLSASKRFAEFNLNGSLDVLKPKNKTTGLDLSLRARRTASLGIDKAFGVWRLGADVKLIGKRYDNAQNTSILGGYGLLGASASMQFAPDWSLLFRVDNATDRVYQQVGNYAMPGRTLYVGLSWQPKK
ncbi:MAG: TonB-dependent receptor [Pseudomonadota bacterium]